MQGYRQCIFILNKDFTIALKYMSFSLFILPMLFKAVSSSSSSSSSSSTHNKYQRCSNRLENALEHMRRRSIQVKTSRSMWDHYQTPYHVYNSFYGTHSDPEDDFYSGTDTDTSIGFSDDIIGGRGYYAKNMQQRTGHPLNSNIDVELEELFSRTKVAANQRQPHKSAISRIKVEDLRVRVPPGKLASRWVEIDKCKFSIENSTLYTRLIFPDLTLSGKVVLHPAGGKCQMILRLRHAGIEFRTIPIGFETVAHEESRRLGAASVRTDSHFAEPGFISVFAHGCQGPSGLRVRQNSKRRFGFTSGTQSNGAHAPPEVELSEPHVILGTAGTGHRKLWGRLHNLYAGEKSNYNARTDSYEGQTTASQSDYNLNFNNHEHIREFYDANMDNRRQYPRRNRRASRQQKHYDENLKDEMNFDDDILNFSDEHLQNLLQPDARAFAEIFSNNNDEREDFVNDALSSELEKLFSMGVRGLLITYMQRALQPAIKETLMENMGYTLSYG